MGHIQNPALLPKVRSQMLMQAIGGKLPSGVQIDPMPCSLRISSFIPGWKCSGPDTVVGCHMNKTLGKSMGSKGSDLAVAAGCQHCHDILDGRDRARANYIADHYATAMMLRALLGLQETHARLVGLGLITVSGMELI